MQENGVDKGIRLLIQEAVKCNHSLGTADVFAIIKRSNNISISLFASESFVEYSHYLLQYFFDL